MSNVSHYDWIIYCINSIFGIFQDLDIWNKFSSNLWKFFFKANSLERLRNKNQDVWRIRRSPSKSPKGVHSDNSGKCQDYIFQIGCGRKVAVLKGLCFILHPHWRQKVLSLEITFDAFMTIFSLHPLTPMSDQDRISPYNINTMSIRRQCQRWEERKHDINLRISSWSSSRFSELASLEFYSRQ